MLSDRLPERWKRNPAIDQGDGFVLLIRAIKISSSSLKYYKLTLLITRASTFKFISRETILLPDRSQYSSAEASCVALVF